MVVIARGVLAWIEGCDREKGQKVNSGDKTSHDQWMHFSFI
jgi:hypothetical protein